MADPKDGRKATCILLADHDLAMLRELALRRAQLEGGRVSQGATIRELIRREHARLARREAGRD